MNEIIRRKRRLPHWDQPGATYFITSCLAGSIPAQGLLDIDQFRRDLAKRRPPAEMSEEDWKLNCWKRTFARCDDWLDREPTVRYLADPALAKEVANSLYFFAGQRYDLVAYVVMPSHFHWVFRPTKNITPVRTKKGRWQSARERIMHSIKRHSAKQCNRLLDREGTFWQDESHDHCVRDEDELERIIEYIELNPVKAGLTKASELWPFSSANDRSSWDVPFGSPLVRPLDSRGMGFQGAKEGMAG